MSEISFFEIPEKLRIHGVRVEFDPRLAGNAVIDFRMLILGQQFTTGQAAAGVPVRVNGNGETTDALFGRGSQIAEMVKAAVAARPFLEIWALPIDENAAGAIASGSLTVTGPATANGTINLYIAGKRVQIGVNINDSANAIASAIDAAITAQTDLSVASSVATNVVTLTAQWKGETGNDIDVRFNYFDESLPAGVTIAISAMAGGTANPDVTNAIAGFGAEWWNWIVTPWTDTANLLALETHLSTQFGAMVAKGARAFAAYRGSHAATGTYGNTRNSAHISSHGTNLSPTPPWIWAAVNGAVAAFSLTNDPARQLNDLALPGILPAAIQERWDDPELNALMFDGIATHKVDRDGTVRIEAQLSMYQTNASGINDDAWLYINTAETLERWRFSLVAKVATKHARQKLAGDDVNVTRGQQTAQPKTVKVTVLDAYQDAINAGWMQDYDGYKNDLVAQIHGTDKNRLDIYESPRLVGNLRIVAVHSEFQ